MWVVAFLLGCILFVMGIFTLDQQLALIGAALMGTGTIIKCPNKRATHRECMRSTARMELECYGQIVSASVQWWLTDNGIVICDRHPGGPHSTRVNQGVLKCTCPERDPSWSGYVFREGGFLITEQPEPDPCDRDCPTDNILADGRILATYCTLHGRRADPRPSRPDPTVAVGR